MLIRRLLCSTNVAALMISAGGGGTVPVFSENYLTSSTSALTFSRAGQAMMYDSTGKLTYAPNNILLNTATLSTQSVTTVAGNYILSIKGTGSVTLTGTSTAGPLNGTGTSNRVDLAFTPTEGTLTLTVSGSVTDARLSQVTYETSFRSGDDVNTAGAAYFGPRFEYDPATLDPAGWLIEGEARTNLALYSNTMSNAAWYNSGSVEAQDATGPDGLTSAWTITEDFLNTSHGLFQPITTSSGTTYTWSAYLKYKSWQYMRFAFVTAGGADSVYVDIDIQNGTIVNTGPYGSATQSSQSIQSVGNGWYRVSVSGTLPSGTTYVTCYSRNTSTNSNPESAIAYAGNNTSGFYFYGAMLEAGSFASSYIPTTTASVARAAESVTGTTAEVGYNASAGTLIIEADAPTVDQLAMIGGFNSIGTTNAILLMKSNAAINAAGANATAYENDGTATALDSTVTINSGSNYRTGMRWNTSGGATGVAISVNGGSPVAGTVRTPTPTTFRLGVRDDGLPLMGHIRMVYNYDTDLGDTEFQAKTTVGAAP